MRCILIVLCMIFGVGCSRVPGTDAVVSESNPEVEDGGVVENADRDKAEAYFVALRGVRSVEEEKKLLTEFGKWLSDHGYSIRVVERDGKHRLSCPHFPPVTPWADHTFLDIRNLELLPQDTPEDHSKM